MSPFGSCSAKNFFSSLATTKSTQTHAIESLRASGGELVKDRVLLEAKDIVAVGAWALAGDRLVLWDSE